MTKLYQAYDMLSIMDVEWNIMTLIFKKPGLHEKEILHLIGGNECQSNLNIRLRRLRAHKIITSEKIGVCVYNYPTERAYRIFEVLKKSI